MTKLIGSIKPLNRMGVWAVACGSVLSISACGRYSFDEKEQHLYDCAGRIKTMASNDQMKRAIIQSKFSAQLMDKSFNMVDQVRAQAQTQQPTLPALPAPSLASGAQQVVSQYPQADANSASDKASSTASAGASDAQAQAQLAQLKAAQEKQLAAFKAKFADLADMGAMQSKLEESMKKDMTASDLARAIADQDQMVRSMKDKFAKLKPEGSPAAMLSVYEATINQVMPTHIYYVTPEIPWSITVSGDDAAHKIICKGYGESLSVPKFTDEYDMTWK